VLLDPELATLRDAPVTGNLSLDVDEAGIDWFDLKVALKVSDTTLTPSDPRRCPSTCMPHRAGRCRP
jgi:hypothetical protein